MENKDCESVEVLRNIDAYEIQQYQQNRYPMLFIDYVEEVQVGKYARGHKNFSYNEWYFPAHFVDEPNVPGFVQIESLTQMFLMTFLTIPEYKGKKTGFIEANRVRFRRKIIPGERLDIEAELKSFRRGMAKGSVKGTVNGELAISLDLQIAIPEVVNNYIPQ